VVEVLEDDVWVAVIEFDGNDWSTEDQDMPLSVAYGVGREEAVLQATQGWRSNRSNRRRQSDAQRVSEQSDPATVSRAQAQ
jgi:hypothetical protein